MAGLSSAQCDKAAAVGIQRNVTAMANVSERNGEVYYAWTDNWHALTQPQKEGMMLAVANADACLTGKARPIFIYYKSELVAQASPTFGVKVLK